MWSALPWKFWLSELEKLTTDLFFCRNASLFWYFVDKDFKTRSSLICLNYTFNYNVMYKLNYDILYRAKSNIWLEMKGITCNWIWFQKIFSISTDKRSFYPMFLFEDLLSKLIILFTNFYWNTSYLWTLIIQNSPIRLRLLLCCDLWQPNWTPKHSTNCCTLFEFFWLCSELLVVSITATIKVLSLPRKYLM